MGCDIHMRAEIKVDGEWRPAGRAFDSSRDHGPYLPATRELLDGLSDGQLLDALAWEGRSLEQVKVDREERQRDLAGRSGPFGATPEDRRAFDPEKDDYHREFREMLCESARVVFADWNERRDRDQERTAAIRDGWRESLKRWDAENPEAAKEYDGYIPDDHPLAHAKVVAPEVARIVSERRGSVSLDPDVRENIIASVLAYRPYGDDELLSIDYDRGAGEPPIKVDEPWEGRNYDLFAILADVRNGRGFAGCPTGEGFVPIADPRGIPEDAHSDTREFMDSYGRDGHSHSWHTLAQLRAYGWDQETVKYGVVAAEVYERCREKGTTPNSWSGGISGPGIVTFDEPGYELWKKRGKPNPGSLRMSSLREDADAPVGVIERPVHAADEIKPHVRMKWGSSYRAQVGESWFAAMEKLAAIVPEGGSDDDVRIVFFFDN